MFEMLASWGFDRLMIRLGTYTGLIFVAAFLLQYKLGFHGVYWEYATYANFVSALIPFFGTFYFLKEAPYPLGFKHIWTKIARFGIVVAFPIAVLMPWYNNLINPGWEAKVAILNEERKIGRPLDKAEKASIEKIIEAENPSGLFETIAVHTSYSFLFFIIGSAAWLVFILIQGRVSKELPT